MTPERWQQIDQLLHAALERKPNDRAAFLAQACGGDEALRNEVESLLASHELAGSFLDAPVSKVAAEMLADDRTRSMVGGRIGP